MSVGIATGLMMSPVPAHAAELRVPADFATIQAAIDAAASGDTVLVEPGTYPERLDFHQKNVRVESTGGAAATTLRVPGGTGVRIGPGAAFVGFTVTGAAATFGAAVSVAGAGTLIQRNVFDGNMQGGGGFGAAIGGNNASPTVDRNVFRNNSCDAQFLSGVVSFVNVSSPRVTNNLFLRNPCTGINMTLPVGSTPSVVNNTFISNRTAVRVDARIATAAQVYRNNILAGNGVGLQVDFGQVSRNPTWQHNLVFGNQGGDYIGIANQTGLAGNISADPEFVNAGQDDHHLQASSPAVDAGSNEGAPAVDLDGSLRPFDGDADGTATADIGAYEFQGSPVRHVDIDIMPGTPQNAVSLHASGILVAILSATDFDAVTAVDRASLTFGRSGSEASLRSCRKNSRDVNRDGLRDLVCRFSVQLAGFQPGDTEGFLQGRTVDATLLGSDTVRIVA
ncbi:MAG TPA: choice-of-anchor Q domain-containing protein [Micromonosporaceae bacterium]|nr:choice-of-anchor Q domain-containing protein [Micromonosporaceae bacterium]